MKPTTRLRILDYLRKHQAATVHEMSRVLGMTGANIRHHLAVLEANDLIEVIDRRNEGRGRPANVYRVSHQVLGSGLDELVGAIIDVWLGGVRDETREAALMSVAERLAGGGLPDPATVLPRRLALTVDRLNGLHYQACWEAGATGPRLILDHCPYAEVIARYPELCRMDAHLLELLLALPVLQIAKLERSKAGFPQCIFAVG
jgi:predicted ArsR family transcriptional regulator